MKNRTNIQGFPVDLYTFDEAIDVLFSARKNIHVVTINPEIIQSAKKNQRLKKIIREAELITPDGVGIKLALKFKGIIQEQVTGVDLSKKILEKAAQTGKKVALVGAKTEVLELAIENVKKFYPNLEIVYSHDGYFNEDAPIIDAVANSGADFLLCAMGSPNQEYFISKLKQTAHNLVMIGVGGTFDVLSGTVIEAPKICKKLGLEWLYRTVTQPKRLKRIFPALPIFFFQSIIDSINSKN